MNVLQWRHKSAPVFVQQLAQDNIKENAKAPHH